jgi:DNA-binding XRE family transcriptional regulator
MGTKTNNCELPQLPSAGVQAVRQRHQRPERNANALTERPRLVWTRRQVARASGLSYRSVVNLEKRRLLRRCYVGLNIALYSDASVKELFADRAQQMQDAP